MREERISIVMPFYNEERFLNSTLTSIVNQTYINFELIAIDDFSTDQSLLLLKEWARKDDRVKIFQNTKKGIIGALQLGFNKSSGRFITRMDADDLMEEKKLEIMLGKLKVHGEGHLALGKVHYFSESKEINEGYRQYENWLNYLTERGANFEDIYTECSVPSPCWMLYRSDFIKCGGFSANVYPEDYDLAFRMMAMGLKIIPENEVLHHWRDHSERASRNDENYTDNTFIPLKVNYFLKLHKNRKVAVWGAGKKGKRIIQELLKVVEKPHWFCNNPKKIGHSIFDIKMQSEEELLKTNKEFQIIVAVANPEEKKMIRVELENKGWQKNVDFFFFA